MSSKRILIVDDEKNIVGSLKEILTDEGYQVSSATDGIGALEMIQEDPPDLVLLDIWLPEIDGIEVLKTVKTYYPETEVLIMTGHGTIDTAVKATKLGAFDFIEKPFSLDQLTQVVESAFQSQASQAARKDSNGTPSPELPLCFEMMAGVKKAIQEIAGQDKPVLLLGEKGSGKEIIAQAIHRQSRNNHLYFIKLNCSIRKQEDISAALFSPADESGENPQSRSETSSDREPCVAYLSGIHSLSQDIQSRLARALESRRQDAGKNAEGFLPVRLFASSSKDLAGLAEKGLFNQKLFKLLNENTLTIPSLREYSVNIPILTADYFKKEAGKRKIPAPELSENAMDALRRYHWPGNIRELRSVLDKLVIAGTIHRKISLHELPAEIRPQKIEIDASQFEKLDSLKETELSWEREFIIDKLKKNNWDLEKTCKTLKTDPKTFREKLKHHAIDLPDPKQHPSPQRLLQRTLKRSVVLCGSGLHSGIKTGLILQPMPPGSGIIFGDISTGKTIPARLENVQSTEYSTCLKKGLASVATIEHIMAVLHMYRITNLLIKIGDEAPVMDGSAKDFCDLIEDGEFEEQDEFYEELVIEEPLSMGDSTSGGPFLSIEPADRFSVSYHMEYPEPIGVQDYTYEFYGEQGFKKEIAPARTFGFLEDVAQLTKMGFASGGKLDNFILLGDKKVLNTELRFEDEFARHKILDILGDFYLLGKPVRGKIKAFKSGHTQNIGLMKKILQRYSPAA